MGFADRLIDVENASPFRFRPRVTNVSSSPTIIRRMSAIVQPASPYTRLARSSGHAVILSRTGTVSHALRLLSEAHSCHTLYEHAIDRHEHVSSLHLSTFVSDVGISALKPGTRACAPIFRKVVE